MIAPMAIAKKRIFLHLIATFFSVMGGIFCYLIGAYFFDLAINIIEFYNYGEKVIDIRYHLKEMVYAWLAILFLAGFTPTYKVFTITSGLISLIY